MKKVFGLFVAVVAVLAMASCGGGSNTPKGVAEQFIKSIQDKDGEKMASLVYYPDGKAPTSSTEKDQLAELMNSKISTTYDNNGALKSYEILSEELSEDGNEAVVKAKMVFEKKTDEDDIKLKKDSEGNWKIDLSK